MSTRRWIALTSVLVVVAVLLGPTLTSYISQRRQIGELRDQVSSQRQNVQALEKERALWNDDEYVEQQARERLKFVKVGDTAYTVIDADPGLDDPAPEGEMARRTGDGPWYGRLWESMRIADDPQRGAP
jgi:cell division protein FtsB